MRLVGPLMHRVSRRLLMLLAGGLCLAGLAGAARAGDPSLKWRTLRTKHFEVTFALRHLRAGKALTVFIEGRIPAPGQKVEPRDGAALLALRSGAPVIPCHISGTLYRDGILAGSLARHRARVRFGPPVDLSDLAGQTGRETVAAATRRIFEHICALAPAEDRPGGAC